MSRRPLTFIVGTGRCGSTALSDVLRLHPGVLSLSELITTLEPGALPDRPIDGERFWSLLASARPFADRMIREGTPLPEHLYPRTAGRFSADSGIPAVCLTTLPHLTSTPDELFDVLRPVLAGRADAPVADHYRALFDTLAERFGHRAVVERSGFSLGLVPQLRAHFPEARFVHLYRDGPDCALSMSRHPGFQLVQLMTEAARGSGGDVPADLERLLADDSYDLASALRRPVPVERYGALWSGMITSGLAALDEIPAASRMSLAFEDLLDTPEHALTRLAGHLGVDADPVWIAAAGTILDAGRRGASAQLSDSELATLRASCAPASRALARSAA
ncbi:sulfotransferase family protein [Streptomyces sp. NPDC058280]|uniref:sulfotransferase family protein n=1 Tax=Streptomyces sp. NPDC058280 TaxID=3346419 RepID=UPI0036E0DF3D